MLDPVLKYPEYWSVSSFLFSLQGGETPLIWASCYGHLEIVSLILSCEANVNTQDKVRIQVYVQNIMTAWHCAQGGKREILPGVHVRKRVLHCDDFYSIKTCLFLGNVVHLFTHAKLQLDIVG